MNRTEQKCDLLKVLFLGHAENPLVRDTATALRPEIQADAEVVLEDFDGSADLSGVEADLAVVFGGDGSILRAAQQMGVRQFPVLGVNLGRLGFLADLTPEELPAVLREIRAGKFVSVEHLMFQCEVIRDGQVVVHSLGLNEAAIMAGPPFAILEVDLYVDSEWVTAYSCDGLIISTPIGSTAHSLSAGGPILAHISHDLRTPLTSMLGYIESLELKKASLTEAEQESFLAIAHKQGQRLSRMIETLFELSSLEAQDTEPAIETFVPAEWLYDVAQKHQLRIEQHGLNIEVDIQEQGLLALADISLLERVMDNLIDNSISHAKSSGTLTLRLATQGDKVAISVADQGKGIAKEEFVGLFEPLVTTEGPKKHDVERHHAGLGLAIAKRIMQLLDGDIFVKSELGVGTVFTLCLPKSR